MENRTRQRRQACLQHVCQSRASDQAKHTAQSPVLTAESSIVHDASARLCCSEHVHASPSGLPVVWQAKARRLGAHMQRGARDHK